METPILSIDSEDSIEDRLTDNAQNNILPARYFVKNSSGEIIEDASMLFERVAENVAQGEFNASDQSEVVNTENYHEYKERFEAAMKELRFMPNSPTLMNAGTDMNQLSACFVEEPRDDMEDIFEKAKFAALIFQSGGGVGYPFHHLRPKGSYINSTGGQASGPVSFMRVFDETCNQVKQGGKRRGAQMGILRVDHPDVGRFAVAKREEGEFDNFNISVGVTDDFIEAVRNDETYTLYDPAADYEEAYKVNEETAKFYNHEYHNNPASAFDTGEGQTVDENIWRDVADSITATTGESLEERWDSLIPEYGELAVNANGEETFVVNSDNAEPIESKTVVTEQAEYALEPGEPMELPARFLWDIMVDGAYQNGEPGIFHYDWTNQDHTFLEESDHSIEATNPCAEQPLSEHEACNLGHINLSLMLEEDAPTWDEFVEADNIEYNSRKAGIQHYVKEVFDTQQFAETTETATRFLENVVTQSDFPLEEIEEKVSSLRKIGVGVMGMAQMLYQMGVPYDSKEGRDICSEVLRLINQESAFCSAEIAEERGVFSAYEESKWSDPTEYPEWFERHTGGLKAENWEDGFPVRNHNQTTIAPTGTTSMIGDTSGGCEPVYSVAFYKNVGGDIQGSDFLVEFDSYFLKTLKANDIDVDAVKAEAEEQMANDEWDGVNGLDTVPKEFGDVFVTTEQIDPEGHTLMQRRLQEHVDSGISKTINMPAEATRSDVNDAYLMSLSETAEGMPAKGITVYRDGSRDEQVKSTSGDMSEAGSGDGMEPGVSDHLVDLYQSDAVGDEAVGILANKMNLELEEVDEGELVKLCPECEEGTMKMQEGCGLCPECGFSPCS